MDTTASSNEIYSSEGEARLESWSPERVLDEAYVYAYPLVLLELIRTVTTNVEEPGADRAPMNQLFHTRDLASPQMTSLTRPNVDTLYSQAYVDLGQEPFVLFKPATDRFCSIQPFDGYSTTPVMLGSGGLGGNKAATFALTGPRFRGEIPEGLMQIKMPTDFVWLLIRTRCAGPHDLPAVHHIQDQLQLRPLSSLGGNYTPERGHYSPACDFDPKERIRTMEASEYFKLFNQLAIRNPGTSADQPALQRFASLGIGPDLRFSPERLSATARAHASGLASMADDYGLTEKIRLDLVEGWVYLDPSIAHFGTDYAFRAAVAEGGFANPVDLAVYPSTDLDDQEEPLLGTRSYHLRFEAGQFPPHHPGGWWSISAYTDTGRLIGNELNRHMIGETSHLAANADGSIDIWFGTQHPGPGRESNWLPTPAGTFSVTMRIYLPTEHVKNHAWKPPRLVAQQ